MVFHAGTALKDGKLVTAGGRVLAVTAVAENLEAAVKLAYEGVDCVSFEGMTYRKDIAHKSVFLCCSVYPADIGVQSFRPQKVRHDLRRCRCRYRGRKPACRAH